MMSIEHNLIKDMYPRLDINNQPYLRIRMKDGCEYNSLPNKFINSDEKGIYGNFILVS